MLVGYEVVWLGRNNTDARFTGATRQHARRSEARHALSLERASGSKPAEKPVDELDMS